MEITKREVIFSVIIVCVMAGAGIFIHNKIDASVRDKNARYNKAIEIETDEMFQYGLETNVGDSFTFGKLSTVDPIYMDKYGPYMSVKRELEEYRKHYRTVTKTHRRSDGTTYTTQEREEYWTWDHIRTDYTTCNYVNFCGVQFTFKEFPVPGYRCIKSDVSCGYHKRYQYYAIKTDYEGTLFADLDEHTINDANFAPGITIDKALEYYSESPIGWLVAFWIGWVVVIVLLVIGFYYIDNRWLEG